MAVCPFPGAAADYDVSIFEARRLTTVLEIFALLAAPRNIALRRALQHANPARDIN